ncbi:MAG: hypothetical protein Q8L23_08640 [Caulobacter sp.]|nr:hypothetical protein [Caulobacter sp.]
MLKRGLWALGTSLRLLRAAHRATRAWPNEPCEIVVTGSPPFLAYLFIVYNRLVWRRTLIYRITDFYPETLFAAGHLPWLRPLAGLFHWLRRGATRIEALGEDQRRRLAESGVPAERVVVVRDASPIQDWSRRTPVARPFPPDKAILLYSGNLGVAHDIDTLCQAYERHVRHGSDRVRLWLNGVGGRVESLRGFCAERDLPLHFSAPAALEDLPEVLRACDGHLVLLGTPFWGYVLPSKIYACLELDGPVFYVGPTQSDVHLLSKDRAAGYLQADPGDVDGCAANLESFADRAMAGRD